MVLKKSELFNLLGLALSEYTVVSNRTILLEEEPTDGFDELLFKFEHLFSNLLRGVLGFWGDRKSVV